jgi:hypothetical protein
VNRAWHWLFGAGIVRTTDNFGTTGEAPSHPELLDHLALRFLEDGQSLKKLVRRIATSSTYRMSSDVAGKAPDSDLENRLLWRANRRRLDAEAIRDALLAVSGRLRTEPVTGPTYASTLASDYGYRHSEPVRSLYVPVFRNALPELFDVFDFADTSMTTGRRSASTVAPQALFLLNNPFVREQAAAAAARLPRGDEAARVERAYRMALGRRPTESELAAALRHGPAGATLFHALFASADFRYVR